MKRRAATGFLIIVCFLLQSTVRSIVLPMAVVPNFLLILTSALGFMQGEREGIFIGFVSGLLMDVFFGSLFGFYALLYTFIGYGSGLFHMVFYDEDIKMPMVWVGLCELVYGFSVYFFMFLLRSKFDFIYYFAHVIFPELICTVAVTMVLYRPIRKYSGWLEKLDAENASDYVKLSEHVLSQENKTEEL